MTTGDDPGRVLGQAAVVNVTVLQQLPQLQQQQEQINEQGKQIAQLFLLHAKAQLSKLRDTATQVMLVAAGETFRESDCTPFKQRDVLDSCIQNAAGSLNVAAEAFKNAADAIVTRRNKAVHPCHIADLDEQVEEVLELITPDMEKLAKWECLVVKNYAAIKKAFPMSFS